jgi:hypothetical protein
MQEHRPEMLVVLDGGGWREDLPDNAVRQAHTPNFDRLWSTCPHAVLQASGKDLGLPPGQMENSEVGHLNIGAGRVVMQDLQRHAFPPHRPFEEIQLLPTKFQNKGASWESPGSTETDFKPAFGSLRHPNGEDGQGRGGAGGEKGGAVSEVINDYAAASPLDEEPIPWAEAMAPWARLYRPVPRMMAAITRDVRAPKIPAPMPSSTWTPISQKLLSDRV